MSKKIILHFLVIISGFTTIYGEWGVSCDIYSRYVWRGTDFGNSPSIQPGISYTTGPLTLGAWSAWQYSGSGNENDLYVTYTIGDYSLTFTDYYFPGPSSSGDFTVFAPDTGAHNIEISLGGSFSGVGLTAAMFIIEPGFYGAFEDEKAPMSKYINLSYGSFMIGLGNGGYTSDGGFTAIELGVSASNDKFKCSWILNPDSGLAFLIIGMSL
tara:strand:- start:16863 stop:17498 length:636 start_codon:yes stop_codon:yes gene_type:complete